VKHERHGVRIITEQRIRLLLVLARRRRLRLVVLGPRLRLGERRRRRARRLVVNGDVKPVVALHAAAAAAAIEVDRLLHGEVVEAAVKVRHRGGSTSDHRRGDVVLPSSRREAVALLRDEAYDELPRLNRAGVLSDEFEHTQAVGAAVEGKLFRLHVGIVPDARARCVRERVAVHVLRVRPVLNRHHPVVVRNQHRSNRAAS